MDNIEKLIQLKKLYESGIITKEELEAEKAKVLQPNGHINQTPPKDKPKPENEVKHNVVSSTMPEKKHPEETIAANPYLKWGIIGGVALLLIIMLCLAFKNSRDYTDNDPIILEDDNSFNTNTSGSRVMTMEEYIQKSETAWQPMYRAIKANPLRAESDYVGTPMVVKVTAQTISESGGRFKYSVYCYTEYDRESFYYYLDTSDNSFYYLDYPVTIWVQGIVDNIHTDFYGVTLSSAKLLMTYANGYYKVYGSPEINEYGSNPGGLDDDGPGADEYLY